MCLAREIRENHEPIRFNRSMRMCISDNNILQNGQCNNFRVCMRLPMRMHARDLVSFSGEVFFVLVCSICFVVILLVCRMVSFRQKKQREKSERQRERDADWLFWFNYSRFCTHMPLHTRSFDCTNDCWMNHKNANANANRISTIW